MDFLKKYNSEIALPTDKVFGNFFSLLFFVIGIFSIYLEFRFFGAAFILLSFILFAVAQMKPSLLNIFNKIWMGIGYLLSLIINPIVMGFIYFMIFSPVAIISKIFGRDELKLKFTFKNSYWNYTNLDTKNKNYFLRQF